MQAHRDLGSLVKKKETMLESVSLTDQGHVPLLRQCVRTQRSRHRHLPLLLLEVCGGILLDKEITD